MRMRHATAAMDTAPQGTLPRSQRATPRPDPPSASTGICPSALHSSRPSLSARLRRVVRLLRFDRWPWVRDSWQVARAVVAPRPPGHVSGQAPNAPLLRAVHRRGWRAVSSPIGWWVLVTLPDGQIAQITTLEGGKYELALGHMPRQTFSDPDSALDTAVRLTSMSRR
jgi:hypothetical protein